MVNGKKYPSIRAAVREEKISKSTLIRYLDDPNKENYYYLRDEQTTYGKIPLFGQKDDNSPSVFFESFQECGNANKGYATNTQNARRKIQSKKPGWRYAHVNQKGEPLRIPYTLKKGEVSFKDLVKQEKT